MHFGDGIDCSDYLLSGIATTPRPCQVNFQMLHMRVSSLILLLLLLLPIHNKL